MPDNILLKFCWRIGQLMRGKLLKFILIFFLLLIGGEAGAQTGRLGLSVSPQIFEIDAFLGESVENNIKIKNTSEVAMPINVRVVNFSAREDSGEMFFDETLESREWLKMDSPDFILEPGERKNIGFSLDIPNDAEPGGHYLVILFEPQLPSFYFKEQQTRSIPIIGVLVMASIKSLSLEAVDTDKQIEVVEFTIPEEQRMQNLEKTLASMINLIPAVSAESISIVDKTPSSFLLGIKNNDIFHHKLEGDLFVYNIFGKKIGETKIARTTILPGKTRQFPVAIAPQTPAYLKWLPAGVSAFLAKNTALGKYRAELVLAVDNSNDERRLSMLTNFWALPWRVGLPLLSLAVILFLIRKRIFAATKVFISKA